MKSGILSPQMTIHEVAIPEVRGLRDKSVAGLEAVDAARVETAAGRDLRGAGDVAFQENMLLLHVRVRDGDVGEQRLGVGMGRLGIDLLCRGELDDLPEVHDGYAVREVAYHVQVVGDEQEREPQVLLEISKQVDDLGLDRYVEGGDRLIGDDEGRAAGEGTGDPDTLALPSRELVGVARRRKGRPWPGTPRGQVLCCGISARRSA